MPGKQAVQNGPAGSRSPPERRQFDPEDPEYIRDLQRPAVIKEDLNEMERRKRVRQILESDSFRKELEELIISERKHGNNTENLRTLEQLSELILPSKSGAVGLPSTMHGIPGHAVVPIADLRGAEGTKYSKEERVLRTKLAALYRLVDLFQWSQGIYNHITLRLSPNSEHFLINPFGLLYHEITASSLVKVDLHGNVIDAGSTGLGINEAGFVLHSTIHQARPDARCVLHLHTPVVGAVAAMKCGLLPISHEAMIVGPVSYHEFQGIVNDPAERDSIAKDLGPTNKVMLLRNHGFVACGQSVEEAFRLAYHLILACETQVILLQGGGYIVVGESVEEVFHLAFNLIQACEAQVRAARAGLENLSIPSEEAQRRAQEAAMASSMVKSPDRKGEGAIRWRSGELEWEAWMRVLDNAGFRTGHIYRQPILRSKAPPPPQSDVEAPPAACAYGAMDETDDAAIAQKIAQMKRDQEKIRWLNSPNVYQKVEFEETGTSEPKKLTKWVQDATSPVHSSAVKVTAQHQFAPVAQNPKEFKEKQRAIKEARRADNISAGPQSKILEGVTWQEAAKMKDAETSGTQEKIIIGAASKGIIDREYRHNAQIYRQLYQPNPFASETDEDIQKYIKEVETRKPDQSPVPGSARDTSFEEEHHHHDVSAGSQSPEEISLMQAAREHQRATTAQQQEVRAPESVAVAVAATGSAARETTFDASPPPISRETTTTISSGKIQPSSSGGWFQRSKSDRFAGGGKREKESSGLVEHTAVSDEEAQHQQQTDGTKSPDKKDKKKKKFKTPSFLRSKKDKKKDNE